MRTDQPTHPIRPAETDQYVRWPAVNDLDTNSDLDTNGVFDSAARSNGHQAAVPVAARCAADPEYLPPAASPTATPAPAGWLTGHRDDGPLPAIGDPWGHSEVGAVRAAYTPAPVAAYYPSAASSVVVGSAYRRTAPLATAAVVSGCVSVPLVLLGGIGGVLGILAVLLGVVSIRQINRDPLYHGRVRAATGIVLGTGSAIIGLPILFFLMLLAGL